jgi:tritrans,polycis-undecaprenyl-diphosphate synthase [geranylgeranyl-diphosphate specific]
MSESLEESAQPPEAPPKLSLFQRIKDKITTALLFPFYTLYKRYLWRQISAIKKPKHLGIILDGNRRFSQSHGLEVWAGHEFGARKVEEVLGFCWELGIRIVTLYVFSIENFSRPQDEVDHIMGLAEEKFKDLLTNPLIYKYKVHIKAIGRMELLPEGVRAAINEVEEATAEFQDYFLNVAIAFDEATFEKYLYTAGIPNPDLIIRTSGEVRISGFLLWQSAYSELYFCDLNWPEIRKIDLWRAVRDYQRRHRRFGR